MARNYAALSHDYLVEMEALNDTEFGRLCRALLKYSVTGKEEQLGGNERFYLKRVYMQERRFQESYADTCSANKENGKLGGRPRKPKKPDGFENNPAVSPETEKTQTETKTEIETDVTSGNTPPTPSQSPPPPAEPKPPDARVLFSRLFSLYPQDRRGSEPAAWEAYRKAIRDKASALEALENLHLWKGSEQWCKQGGQYIPYLDNWLSRGAWRAKPPQPSKPAIPQGASGVLGPAELEAIRKLMETPIADITQTDKEDIDNA